MFFDEPIGKRVARRVVVVHRQADLLEVVDALHAPGRLPRRLHGGQEQRDQDRDDRDHDQQFDQRESRSLAGDTAEDGDSGSGRRKASN